MIFPLSNEFQISKKVFCFRQTADFYEEGIQKPIVMYDKYDVPLILKKITLKNRSDCMLSWKKNPNKIKNTLMCFYVQNDTYLNMF